MTKLKRMAMHRRIVFLAAGLPFIVGSSIAFVWQAMAQAPPGQPRLPAPPRIFINTTYTAPSGRTIAVGAGGDLQAALNAAQPGDVITLEPGAVFRGNFTLPKKPGDAWIVVRTATPDDKFAPQGARVTPAAAPLMPKIVSPNGGPAISALPGAHHYRFIGIEFTVAADVKIIYAIVEFGGTQTTEADTPHDLIVDRSYVHGQPGQNSARGVLLNSASSAVIDSYISEIHGAGFDSQAVLGYNGPGPFKIVNNFLESAAENIMFGGADPAIRGLVPSDIEIRGHHLFKPLGWFRDNNPSLAGVQWTIKNLLEFKNAQRVLVEGNFLENAGSAVLLTPRNQSGGAPWSGVQDVLFRNNIVTNAGSGLVAIATDNEHPSQPTRRITIFNNLWFVASSFFNLGADPPGFEDVVIDHNTAIPAGHHAYRIDAGVPPAIGRFRLTNNLMGFGGYGVSFSKADEGLAKLLPGAIIAKNALVNIADTADGQGADRNRPYYINQAMYASFPNAAAAGINVDGTLTAKSPNRRAGTDGKDIGVDFAELPRPYTVQSPRH
jgi:hypothetical protein